MHRKDYTIARCLSVCLSVRHTPILCLTAEHIIKILSSPRTPIFVLVFSELNYIPKF